MKINKNNIFIHIATIKNALYDTELRTNHQYIKENMNKSYNIIKDIELYLINNK
jgi:hypothetical protein